MELLIRDEKTYKLESKYEHEIIKNKNYDFIFFKTNSIRYLPIIEIDNQVIWNKSSSKFIVKPKDLEIYQEIKKIANNFIENNPSYFFNDSFGNQILINMPRDKKIRVFYDTLSNKNIYYGAQTFSELVKNNFWKNFDLKIETKIFLKVEFFIRIDKAKKQIYLCSICYQICFSTNSP